MMTPALQFSSLPRTVAAIGLLGIFMWLTGCGSSSTPDNREAKSNLIVINAPATGTVRRVFAREGVTLDADEALFEIAVDAPVTAATLNADSEHQRQRAIVQQQRQAATRQDEKERAAVEVARVEALVREGSAPQSQLDAARAVYQQAEQQTQTTSPPVAAFATPTPAAKSTPTETITVRATESGTLRVINIKTGDRVFINQPVATIAKN